MLNNLESDYDCANAGADLHALKEELQELQASLGADPSQDQLELRNRIENQIAFIENKCSIPPKGSRTGIK
ncbi:hypothetical protein SD70_18020 [Gordoniibacillus kamchatkensis]|uniref:DUF2524 domain-containing protein n=1 Tax=Gordoniibacillus kamchatkensis TaxID=1590651 RepID=A0ABR5AFF4_9BACL|nr:hypothetical protein [Paenibacillus sp. VKM B-2647]KIL39793.1 hypothetical protein SD70_18020 [Paenibacillus sp. VKM B-2647]